MTLNASKDRKNLDATTTKTTTKHVSFHFCLESYFSLNEKSIQGSPNAVLMVNCFRFKFVNFFIGIAICDLVLDTETIQKLHIC